MQRQGLAVLLLAHAVAGEATAAAVQQATERVAMLQARLHALEGGAHLQRIVPALAPVSDKKFFDGAHADYPTDTRPIVPDQFSYPYPHLQDDTIYDKDYVTDENKDDGYWAAEERYSRIRTEMTQIKDNVIKAKAEAVKKKKEVEAAEAEAKKAQATAVAAETEEEKAEAIEKEADKNSTALNGTIASQEDTVSKEMADLEDCKKELSEAKKKLKELVDEAEKTEAAEALSEAEKGDLEKKLAAAEKEEEDLANRIAEERGEAQAKERTYQEEVAHAKELETELEQAAKKLRSSRAKNNGGTHAHSAAPQASLTTVVCLGVAASLAAFA